MFTFPIDFLIQGAILGALYSYFTIGFSLVYAITEDFHFAHGGILALAGYVFVALFAKGYGFAGIFAALVVAVTLSLWTVRLYRSLRERGATNEVILIASFVLVLFFDSVLVLLFGTDVRAPQFPANNAISVLSYRIPSLQLLVIGVSFVVFFLLYMVLSRSTYGFAMRAASNNEMLARVVGVDTDFITDLGYLVAAVAGTAGVIFVAFELNMSPGIGLDLILKVFVATVLGGIGSFKGAFVGAYALGYLEAGALRYLPTGLSDGVVFTVLVVLLVYQTQGLLGSETGDLSW